jgi:serine/threonine-protein phosphatase 4 regulatory subunit 1
MRLIFFLNRLVHVKMLADVSENVGFNQFVETIIPLLDPLSKDVEPVVKQHLVEQIKLLSKYSCSAGAETGYKVMLEKLLPLTGRLLEDDKQEVRQSAAASLVDIAQLVKPDDLGQYVLTMILV